MEKKSHLQYIAVREQAGLFDLSSRGKVAVTGPDRVSFLHSMISNDVMELEDDSGRYATFLTPRGKMISDFFVYKFPESLLLDVSESRAAILAETLERFVIMDDVQVRDESDQWAHLSVQGPMSRQIVEEVVSPKQMPGKPLNVTPTENGTLLISKSDFSESGLEIICAAELGGELKRRILEHPSAIDVSPGLWEILRLEAGIPAFGVDMDEGNYPMEAQLFSAISFTKGCYVGQEVVAKATHVGGVSRHLCKLIVEGDRVPAAGDLICVEGGEAGKVTSSVFSPGLGAVIALGYLKRAVAKPGTEVVIRLEGGRSNASVVEQFLS